MTFKESPFLTYQLDVRFKANGLESIEVQDNGIGISKNNYESVGKSCRLRVNSRYLILIPSVETLHLKAFGL